MTTSFNLLINELTASEDSFHAVVKGIAGTQWSFKPAPDVWSAAEVVEHIAVVEVNVSRLMLEKILEQPLAPERRAEVKPKDSQITALMFDRSTRREAPERVRPTGRWSDPDDAVKAFTDARDRLIDWVSKTDADLRGYAAEHPVFGVLDGKQWLLFAAAHCARHTRQIGELKKMPGFPDAGG